jgi:hypothetical protein
MLGIVPFQQRHENHGFLATPPHSGAAYAPGSGSGRRVELGQAGRERAHLRVDVGGVVADREVAPGRHGVHDLADDPGRILKPSGLPMSAWM